MSKHMPGPWRVIWRSVVTQTDPHAEEEICRFHDARNGPLIAAAPDYDKAARDFLELWPLGGYELEAYCEATLVPALRAAIAKATGEKP